MSPTFGGSVFVRGKYKTSTLLSSASGVNTWNDLITSGTLPADSTMQVHIYDGNDNLLLGSQPFNSIISISGNSIFQSKSLKIEFDATWISGTPIVSFFDFSFNPSVLGDSRGAWNIQYSGGF